MSHDYRRLPILLAGDPEACLARLSDMSSVFLLRVRDWYGGTSAPGWSGLRVGRGVIVRHTLSAIEFGNREHL
jgi:hypothetical protein